jgi:TM2 domain-containing membrane protein YozV
VGRTPTVNERQLPGTAFPIEAKAPEFRISSHAWNRKQDTMSKALKGALLSALVFPGCGQFFLKRYVRGSAFLVVTLGGLLLIVWEMMQRAMAILERIDLEGGALDMEAISRAAGKASSLSGNTVIEISLVVIILCWLIGIADAYRVGNRMDQRAGERGPEDESGLPPK